MKGQLSEHTGGERDRRLCRIPKNPRERGWRWQRRREREREVERGGERENM